MRIAFFSICAKNYLAYVRTLFASVRRSYPDVDLHLILSDRIDGTFDPAAEIMTVVEAEDLGIDDLDDMAFRYDVTEFATAIKPHAFLYLFEKFAYDAVIFLDPDIFVTAPLTEVHRLLQAGAPAVLTPHVCQPVADDGCLPNDRTFLRAGIYNLGFLALADSLEVRQVLTWWRDQHRRDCRVDLEQGLHVDQKWMDFLPSFLDGTAILRDAGYNVAYWNLMHRPVTRDHDGWRVGGRPLTFVHFSGVESPNPEVFSKHQNRFNVHTIGDLKGLLDQYRREVAANGHQSTAGLAYAYGSADGRAITPLVRRVYREEIAPHAAGRAPRFEAVLHYCRLPAPRMPQQPVPLTRLMHRVWLSRPDLQAVFPLELPEGRQGLWNWFNHAVTGELGMDPAFAPPPPPSSTPPSMCRHRRRIKDGARLALRTLIRLRPLYTRLVPGRVKHEIKTRLLRLAYSPGMTPAIRPEGAQTAPSMPAPQGATRDAAFASGALLVGYPRAELGMGSHIRLTADALEAAGVPHGLYDFTENIAASQGDDRYSGRITTERFKASIFHINADQMPVAWQALGADFFRGSINIGYWMWELSEFPDAWLPAMGGVDELWAATRFIQDALAEKAGPPVVYMPKAITAPVPSTAGRRQFGIPEDCFAFLFYFDFASYISRKNPWATIAAFQQAFPPGRDDVTLVIKTLSGDRFPDQLARLRAHVAGDPRIRLLTTVLPPADMAALVLAADAFVSLHRSEGIGLGMAESMALGRPVIATNYSGNVDFMNADVACLVRYRLVSVAPDEYPHGNGQVWADPEIEHAAWFMRRLADDPVSARALGQAAKAFIAANFSPLVVGERCRRRLVRLGALPPS